MLARHFPPIGGAGVHRSLGTVRHVSAHGYEPTVVSGATADRDRWQPRDEGLLDGVPDHVPVLRVPPEPPGAGSRFERLLGRPPAWVPWWVDRSAELGIELGRDADLVYASCLPYVTAFAGARVAAAHGLPWVADLEDAWALDEMRVLPSGVHSELDRREMRRALQTASAIITAAPEAAVRLRAAMPRLAERIPITSVPIGYEPAELAVAPEPRPDGVFRIVHTGSMHLDLAAHLRATHLRRRLLGGAVPGLDIAPRSHLHLVAALRELLEAEPDLRGRVELHLAGELTAADRVAGAGCAFVKERGLLSHRDTAALMRSADLLFLPMHDLPLGRRATLVPYKTYEYLAAGRPILAAVPDGDTRDLLAPLACATVVRPTDVRAMVAAVRERIAAAADGPEADHAPPAEYERARSVARIAAVLDGVMQAQPQPCVAA
jgi:glycosyltransferase involved in cell wall biosynthesis